MHASHQTIQFAPGKKIHQSTEKTNTNKKCPTIRPSKQANNTICESPNEYLRLGMF